MAFADIVVKIGADLGDFSKKMQDVESKMGAMGQKVSGAGQAMATTFGAAGLAIGAGLGIAVNKSMDFEAQISRVGAIAGASGKDLDALRDSALELGASTSKSASEVAIAQEGLAAMGFTTQEVIGAMPGVIAAAEASGADMARTSEVMASALNIFGLEATEATRVADILAQTANVSAADIDDMGYALKYAGPVAANLGISMEELSASIGLMTNAGLDGSSAGTAMRAGLLALLNPSNENSKAMEALGISVTDANGKFLGISGVVESLSSSMEGMTDAQKTATLASLVGTEASSGFLALMNAGPAEIDKMTASLENSGGASAKAAAAMKDNLKGALEELGGAFETAQITIGTALTPAIQAATVFVTGLANAFNGLSPQMQSMIAIGAAVTAGVLLLVAAFGGVLMVVGAVMSSIAALGGAAAVLAGALAFITSPVTLVVAALVALGVAFGVAYAKSETLRAGVASAWEDIKARAIAVWGFIAPYISQAMTAVSAFVQSILAQVVGYWQTNGAQITAAVQNIWSFIQTAMTAIGAVFQFIWPFILALIVSTWNAIKNVIQGALGVITGIVSLFSSLFTGNWEGMWEATKQIFTSALQLLWGVINLYFIGKFLGPLKSFGSVAGGVIKGAWNFIKGIFTSTLATIRGVITSGFNAYRSTITSVMNAIRSVITSIWNTIRSVFTTVLNGIRSVVTGGFNAYRSVITTVMNAIRSLITTVWNAISSVFTTVINAMRSTITGGFNAYRNVITTVMNAIRSVITSVWNASRSVVTSSVNAIRSIVTSVFNSLRNIVSSAMNGVKSAIVSGWNASVSFLKGIDLTTIGKNIIQGLINGITSMIGAVGDAIKGVADKVKNGIKGALDINSPSKVTTQYGKWTSEGFANGIQKNSKKAEAQAKAMAHKVTEAIKNAEVKFDTNKISADQYINTLKKIDAQHKLTGEQSRKVQTEINAAMKEKAKQAQAEAKAAEDFYKKLDKINDDYVAKVKATGEQLKATEKALTDDYKKQLAERKSALMNFASIFDEITPKDVSGDQLIANLGTQVNALKQYATSINALKGRGLSQTLLEELENQGPKAAAEIAALATLNDAQLVEYQRLYDEKARIAAVQASKEMVEEKAELARKIAAERKKATDTVNAYKSAWLKEINALKATTIKEMGALSPGMKDAGKDAIVGLISGMNSMKGPLEAAAKALADSVSSSLKSALKIKSPSRVMMALGGYTGAGFAKGIAQSEGMVAKAVSGMSNAAINGVAPFSNSSATYGAGNGSSFNPSTTINVYSNQANPVEIAKRQRQEQRRLAAEWGV